MCGGGNRQHKGLEIAATAKIAKKGGAWLVPSQSGKGRYTVCLDPTEPHWPCAKQWDDVVALRRHPGDRDLCRRRADLLRDRAQLLDQREVMVEVVTREARRAAEGARDAAIEFRARSRASPCLRHEAYIARRVNLPQVSRLAENQNCMHIPRCPASIRGALRDRHERGKRDAMDAKVSQDVRH